MRSSSKRTRVSTHSRRPRQAPAGGVFRFLPGPDRSSGSGDLSLAARHDQSAEIAVGGPIRRRRLHRQAVARDRPAEVSELGARLTEARLTHEDRTRVVNPCNLSFRSRLTRRRNEPSGSWMRRCVLPRLTIASTSAPRIPLGQDRSVDNEGPPRRASCSMSGFRGGPFRCLANAEDGPTGYQGVAGRAGRETSDCLQSDSSARQIDEHEIHATLVRRCPIRPRPRP